MQNFADRLLNECKKKKSLVLVGIDPRKESLPANLKELAQKKSWAEAYRIFGREVLDAVADVAVAVKPQVAFYEALGPEGMMAFQDILQYAKEKNILSIADIKRGDIGTTAEAYAEAFLSEKALFPADSVTINPYLGLDGVEPFLKYCNQGKGVYILVKTSNKSSIDFQNQKLANGSELFNLVAKKVSEWGQSYIGESGYSSVGAVVGATWPEEAMALRKMMPNISFLIPGYGAQGGAAKDALASMDENNLGGVVNSSRSIIFAFDNEKYKEIGKQNGWQASVSQAAEDMRLDLNQSKIEINSSRT